MSTYFHPDLPGFVSPAPFLLQGIKYPRTWWLSTPQALIDAMGFKRTPAPLPPVPESVTRRQILTGLAVIGWITEQEALAALTIGATPAAVDAVIAALPAEQQFATRMKWAGFQTAFRDDEMVAALATIEGKTGQEIDDFFRVCAGIE